jgi:branched-chain amino acid transport system permease protein
MAGALGVNQRWLFTGVFALGALLAGLGGALQIPREPASLNVDLQVISDAFVVVVVGGLGSIPGAFLAALLIAETKAFCTGLGYSEATLVIEFVIMAMVLALRPWGLLGRAQPAARNSASPDAPLEFPDRKFLIGGAALLAVLALVPLAFPGYALVLLTDILIFALFAASLHFIMGPGGLYSFGHAAYFGLGAYAAGILSLHGKLPMELALALAPLAAGLGGLVFGWFCVRLSGVYSAMLTLAFAQIAWSAVFQWDTLTGGSNGIVGIWPAPWLSSKTAYYFLTLLLCASGISFLWRAIDSPFGHALRAARDSPPRADASGIDVRATQWAAFTLAGLAAGVAGALYAFSKGSISPESLGIQRSVDGLVMVMLGGIQTLTGPLWGAALFTWLQDAAARNFDYWRAATGMVVLALVLVLPNGIGSFIREKK